MKRILVIVGFCALAALSLGSSTLGVSTSAKSVTAAKGQECPVTVKPNVIYALSTGQFLTVSVSSTFCGWTATNNDNWITIKEGFNGYGDGQVTIMTWQNNGGIPRVGTLTIGNQTISIIQAPDFSDILFPVWGWWEVNKLYARGIVSGCGGYRFCPDDLLSREQMAILVMRSLGVFEPPVPATQRFVDVPPTRAGYAFIEQLALRGISLGCGNGRFCPDAPVSRESIALILCRAMGIPNPPTPATQWFTDVPPSRTGYAQIDQLVHRFITTGCGSGLYCPDDFVTRRQMAIFLFRAFDLN